MPTEPAIPDREVLELLLVELRRLGAAVEKQNERLAALEEENRTLRQSLEPPKDDKAAYVGEMEQVHADLERPNRYLMGELDRRDAEAEKVKKSWWRWWG